MPVKCARCKQPLAPHAEPVSAAPGSLHRACARRRPHTCPRALGRLRPPAYAARRQPRPGSWTPRACLRQRRSRLRGGPRAGPPPGLADRPVAEAAHARAAPLPASHCPPRRPAARAPARSGMRLRPASRLPCRRRARAGWPPRAPRRGRARACAAWAAARSRQSWAAGARQARCLEGRGATRRGRGPVPAAAAAGGRCRCPGTRRPRAQCPPRWTCARARRTRVARLLVHALGLAASRTWHDVKAPGGLGCPRDLW